MGIIEPKAGQIWRSRINGEHLLVTNDVSAISNMTVAVYTNPAVRSPRGRGFCTKDWITDNFDYVRSLRD